MIDREHELPITRQAEALNISRGSVYYLPRPVPDTDLALMQRLDRLHLEFPFAGSRMLGGLLAAEGPSACEDADAADGDRSSLSPSTHDKARAGPQDLPVPPARDGDHASNQVWAMDITYIPMARGFVYLAVMLGAFQR